MDSTFDFLSCTQVELLHEILARRNPELLNGIQKSHVVSRADAETIMSTLSDEFTDNLDEDWEPTDYGQTVNSLLAQVNTARIGEWPE